LAVEHEDDGICRELRKLALRLRSHLYIGDTEIAIACRVFFDHNIVAVYSLTDGFAITDLYLVEFVDEHLCQRFFVFVLGCQASANHVVRIDHCLNQLALQVSMWLIRTADKTLAWFRREHIQEEYEK
jgi:hypothetical protein